MKCQFILRVFCSEYTWIFFLCGFHAQYACFPHQNPLCEQPLTVCCLSVNSSDIAVCLIWVFGTGLRVGSLELFPGVSRVLDTSGYLIPYKVLSVTLTAEYQIFIRATEYLLYQRIYWRHSPEHMCWPKEKGYFPCHIHLVRPENCCRLWAL